MYNGYNPNYNNPYYNPNYNIQPSYGPQSYGTTKPTDNQLGQQSINTFQQPQILQGKQVESIDIVKNIEIPMDGSISYFPVADGSAIVSKQLQTDGTSKIQIYKLSKDTKEFLNNVILITMNGHITCSKYGIIYDTFDPRDREAEFVWIVE